MSRHRAVKRMINQGTYDDEDYDDEENEQYDQYDDRNFTEGN